MKYPNPMRTAALAAAVLAAAGAAAQTTAPTAPVASEAGSVVTDVGPTPAHERDSLGAIVLDGSLVRAQRDRSFEQSSARTGLLSVGRGTVRDSMKARTQADLRQAREAEALEFYRRGAASQTAK